MKVQVEKQPKSTLKLSIVVPKEDVKKTYEKILDDVVIQTEIPGFRKGKAPKEKVLEKTDISTLYGEVVNALLQTYYPQALKEHHVSPVSNPKVEIKEFELEKDFVFDATVAIRPEIKIGDYRPLLVKKYQEKNETLKKTNEERLKTGEKIEADRAHLLVEDIIEIILGTSEVELADIIVDEEINRMLTRLVDQTQAVGLSMEDYLKSQNKTAEQLREQYRAVAEKTLKTEFVLSQLIGDMKIEINDSEIDEVIGAAGDAAVKERLKDPVEKWYIKSILAKNKLISELAKEAERNEHA